MIFLLYNHIEINKRTIGDLERLGLSTIERVGELCEYLFLSTNMHVEEKTIKNNNSASMIMRFMVFHKVHFRWVWMICVLYSEADSHTCELMVLSASGWSGDYPHAHMGMVTNQGYYVRKKHGIKFDQGANMPKFDHIGESQCIFTWLIKLGNPPGKLANVPSNMALTERSIYQLEFFLFII
jgi:hypothetical protein